MSDDVIRTGVKMFQKAHREVGIKGEFDVRKHMVMYFLDGLEV